MNSIGLFFFISLTFSPLAAVCAFLITYEEYKMHLSKRKAILQSLEMGLFTFIVFVIIGILAGYLFSKGFQ